MYRVAILPETGATVGKNFDTREKADEWILSMMNKINIKRFKIKDLTTGEILETDKGRRDKKEE